jgi:hypothetical protein
LKLKCDEPLSNVAFNFNVRRYREECHTLDRALAALVADLQAKVGRCRLKLSVESTWFQRLNPKYDEPFSNFAFNFNLRRYSKDEALDQLTVDVTKYRKVWRCRLNPVEARVETNCIQRLQLKYNEPLSNFAFNFHLRRYIKGMAELGATRAALYREHVRTKSAWVGRCRLTVSKPELKARLVSVLETKLR